jgi:uncharacterized protein (TIGR02453 family)
MKANILEFLTALSQNNNREWFQSNKKLYEAAKAEIEQFVNTVIPVIAGFDETLKHVEAKECMFRIFRDVRFAKDKSPYKTNMGAWMTQAGRKSSGPGYYIHIQPGESFLATGVYMPEPDQLKKIRMEVYYNIDEFLSILNAATFKKFAAGLDDMDRAKMPPKDFPKDFPHIDILKNRHFIASRPIKDAEILDTGFQQLVCEMFQATSPLNKFLKRALEG